MVRAEGTTASDSAQVNNRAHSSSDKDTPETESPAWNIKGKEKKKRRESVGVRGIATERDSNDGRPRRDSPGAASAAGGNFRFRE